MYYFGAITARGGASYGDGGFAEVSGKQDLDFAGRVDMLAAAGRVGTLFLDPLNIIVAAGGSAAYTDVSTYGANPGQTKTIDPATLEAVGASVVLQATNDITVNSDVNLTTAGASFTAQADHAVKINAGVTTNNGDIMLDGITTVSGTLDAGAGDITITNDVYNGHGGGIILNSGAELIGHDITLHAARTNYGSEIRLLSGSQITASNSVVLREDSTYTYNNTLAGINLAAGATVTAPSLTAQTAGGTIDYNGTTLNVSGNTLFRYTGSAANITNIHSALSANNIIFESNAAPNFVASVSSPGNVTLRPYTLGTTMGVAGATGTLQYTSALLDKIAADTIVIGGSGYTGALNAGAYTWNSDAIFNAGSGAITVSGAQNAGAHDFTLITDAAAVLSAAVTTSGTVAIKSDSASTSIGVAGGAGSLAINTASLSNVSAGSIVIGRTDGSGEITADAYGWSAPVTLQSGNGDITIEGAQTMGSNTFLARTHS